MKFFILTFIASLLLFGMLLLRPSSGNADNDPLLIIANKSVPQETISVAETKQIFLKQRANWSAGGKIVAMNAKPGTPERKAFQAKVLDMDATSETSYWEDQKIKKGLLPPPEFPNIQKAVFSLKGGIGYCLKSQYKVGTSKILLIL